MDPAALPLRDIHLPPAVGWWPVADAWWWMLAAIMVAMLALAVWRLPPGALRAQLDAWLFGRHGLARGLFRVRRAAVAELQAIEDKLAVDSDVHDCARALSKLLRRISLRVHGTETAKLGEQAWLATLTTLSRAPLPAGLLDILRDAPYSPRAAQALPVQRYRDTILALRPWMQRLRIPAPANPGTRHATV
jgi:Domain of unknown function (DUF4381)